MRPVGRDLGETFAVVFSAYWLTQREPRRSSRRGTLGLGTRRSPRASSISVTVQGHLEAELANVVVHSRWELRSSGGRDGRVS